MKYQEYKQQDFTSVAQEVSEFWKSGNVFERSISEREGKPTFTFFEGPPSANGVPGIHHVMSRTVKDVFCRYKTMQGFQVKRKAGWDTHGLPVELQVEKELGITKDDIGKKISVQEYNQKCREAVMKYTHLWRELTEQMGYWVDLDNPYITYETKYVETLWHLLKRLYDKDLLYKGYTIQPYSPAAGTGLSSHELNQPGTYRDVKDTSIVAQFKVKLERKSDFLFTDSSIDVYFLAWTTTPWTLPSNAALVVGEKITYAKVKTYNPYTFKPMSVILAADLVGKYFSEKAKEISFDDYKGGDKLIPWIIEGTYKGSQLLGIKYEQLMPYVQPSEPAFYVIPGDFVTIEDGTGIVHCAPTFGADDYRVAKAAGIPPIMVTDENGNQVPLVNKQGKFVSEVTDYAGMYVKNYGGDDEAAPGYKSTDVLISIKLKEENKAFKVEKYEHSYPHCWRTDKPILYYPMESWFIKTTAYKSRLVELNNTINWKPASTGSGRFGNWLENLVDWNLSRSRYWGTPLPIWRSEDGTAEVCIGSLTELKEGLETAIASGKLSEGQIAHNQVFIERIAAGNADLHRPFVDEIVLVSANGEVLTRETDLVDVWFDSGAMPYAQWHFPFENEEIFNQSYPADFIAEGVDQTRGWFFTLHALAVMLFDQVAFKNVIANGLVLDKKGEKMSKRLGNVINPFETLKQYGPDATRWYMIANAPPWENLKFDLEGIKETSRKLFGTLYNTYNFFALYANLDGFSFKEASIPLAERTESDRWILSRLNSLIKEVEASFNDYDPTKGARAIQEFVNEELSNWYVRLNRKRFWKGEYNADKIAAYQTLYTCLEVLAQLMAPVAPFYAERLFIDLNTVSGKSDAGSVHLSLWPTAQDNCIDLALEERMHIAQQMSSLIHSLRKKHNLKVRQPLQRVLVPTLTESFKAQVEKVAELILSETNVKTVEYVGADSGIIVKKLKPNFKKLGAHFGAKMKDIANAITLLDADAIAQLENNNSYQLAIGADIHLITLEDVEIRTEDIPGWLVASEGGITIALDTTLTPELIKEGIARDVVNRVQNLRKDTGLEVQDKIELAFLVHENAVVNEALTDFAAYIQAETQALKLVLSPELADTTALDIDDYTLQIKLEVVK
jgi:isoleucyl-tRNA synthetase